MDFSLIFLLKILFTNSRHLTAENIHLHAAFRNFTLSNSTVMKKALLILVASLLVMLNVHGKNLNAYFSFCTFDQPGKSPYVETYLNVSGNTVQLIKNEENKLQGKIEVQWIYKQNEKIVHFDKYNLLSPPVDDASKPIPDFVDQQRVSLPNGDYVLELKITDRNSSAQGYVVTQPISVNFPVNKVNISDIELLESYTPTVTEGAFSKNGYDMVPFVTNYYPKSVDVLKFYAEIYNTKEILGDQDFLVSYNISGHQNKRIINNLVSFKKQKSETINILLAELPITDVTSGNYSLVVEVKDKSNNLLVTKQILFQRSKPAEKQIHADDMSLIKIENTFVSYMNDKDTLADYISSLYPISSQSEVNVEENQLKYNNLGSMQQFFYYFWSNRDAQDPERAWLAYKDEVDKANSEFSCLNKKGYETDRGRVFLQYGAPNSMDKDYYEGSGYPYEIWQYYKSGEQSNIKFVFMTRNLTSGCFELIHSTARGEFYDANWATRLRTESKSNAISGDVDRGDDYSHRNSFDSKTGSAKEKFEHPK